MSRLPGKRARPVLRGLRRGDAPELPDYWAVDVLQAAGATVHLAHPLGVKGFRYRRVKNDLRDAADLADLLRMNRLPEAWIAPPATRELRELVRYRATPCPHQLGEGMTGSRTNPALPQRICAITAWHNHTIRRCPSGIRRQHAPGRPSVKVRPRYAAGAPS